MAKAFVTSHILTKAVQKQIMLLLLWGIIFSISISIHEQVQSLGRMTFVLFPFPASHFRDALCASSTIYTLIETDGRMTIPMPSPRNTQAGWDTSIVTMVLGTEGANIGQGHHLISSVCHSTFQHLVGLGSAGHPLAKPGCVSILHRFNPAVDGTTITSRASPVTEVDRGGGFVWGTHGYQSPKAPGPEHRWCPRSTHTHRTRFGLYRVSSDLDGFLWAPLQFR